MANSRMLAQELIEQYVPKSGLPYHSNFSNSDRRHNEIINRFQLPDGSVYREYAGIGTTCGYLCQWLLFRLGLKDTKMLNRTTFRASVKPSNGDFDDFKHMSIFGYSLPKKRITKNEQGKSIHAKPASDDVHFQTFFEIGMNLSKLCLSSAMNRVSSARLEDLRTIGYGDIGWIQGTPKKVLSIEDDVDKVQYQDTSHVFVIKNVSFSPNNITMETVESGQCSLGTGGIDVKPKVRTFEINSNKQIMGNDGRVLMGFLSLDRIDFGVPILDFDEWQLYDPLLAHMYYQGHGISAISTPIKKHK